MLILTGGAGFIGTNMLMKLNQIGEDNILIVDDINTSMKWKNLVGKKFRDYLHKDDLWEWLKTNPQTRIDSVIHLGACSSTTENDFDYLMQNNVRYGQKLWELCLERQIPFIYASSAATYGNGSKGFSDDQDCIPDLLPINAYGFSKHLFDLWVLRQTDTPPKWAGLKFFNNYGPYQFPEKLIPLMILNILDSKPLPVYGDGQNVRNWIHAQDTCSAIEAI